jgi:cation diffusion facilitator family transporter
MMVESVQRWIWPREVDVASSLPVAVLGLVVNLGSVLLLRDDHQHEHDHENHDHNHRAALMHVIADTLTSGLAILALLAVRYFGWTWLDAASGVVGGILILHWSAGLCRGAALELLDVVPAPELEDAIRSELESNDDTRVSDLHIWPLGEASHSCIATVISGTPREPDHYRAQLARFGLAHLTIEVQRCADH